MTLAPGDLVLMVTETGDRLPARLVEGPHLSGEFEIVTLCDPDHWPDGPKDASYEDHWCEWKYPWPVEALELAPDPS